jgi:exosortase/archaeosortase family protein
LVRAVLIGFIEPAWGRGLVILAAILLSIANNRFRIFTLSMLGVYVDFGFPHLWLHHQGGTMFFLVFLADLFVLLRFVGWAEHSQRFANM